MNRIYTNLYSLRLQCNVVFVIYFRIPSICRQKRRLFTKSGCGRHIIWLETCIEQSSRSEVRVLQQSIINALQYNQTVSVLGSLNVPTIVLSLQSGKRFVLNGE